MSRILPRIGLAAAWGTALVLLSLAALHGERIGLVAGVTLVVLAGIPTLSRLRRDILDGAGLYGLVTVAFLGLFSLGWLGRPALPAPGIEVDDVSRALVIVAAGLVAFSVGARAAGAARRRPPLRYSGHAGAPPWLLVALFGVGAVGTAVGIASRTVGYTANPGSSAWLPVSQVFVQLAGTGSLVILACAIRAFAGRDRKARRLVWVLLGPQILIGFALGFKGLAVLPVLYAGLAFVSCRGRVPWRLAGGIAAVFVLVILPANILYRSVLRDDPGADLQATPAVILDQVEGYLSSRLRLIDHVALIDARTPEVFPFGDGGRYTTLPALVLVPRAVWPGKPLLDDGLTFSHTYWEIPAEIKTSTPPTQVGDLLRNFGVLGVIVGLAVWGLAIGAFTRYSHRFRSARWEMVYLVSLAGWVTYVESDLPQLIAGATRTLLVAVAVAWLLLPGRSTPAGGVRLVASATTLWRRSRRAPAVPS